MTLQIEQKTITANPKMLSATWTIESMQMLRPIFGIGQKKIPLKPTYKGKKRTFKGRNKWLNSHFTGNHNREAIRICETIRKENDLVKCLSEGICKEIDKEIIESVREWSNREG